MLNNLMTNTYDSGAVELGGEFLTLRGCRHINTYCFGNLQQALERSTVLTLWPPVDMSKNTPSQDSVYWTRSAKK